MNAKPCARLLCILALTLTSFGCITTASDAQFTASLNTPVVMAETEQNFQDYLIEYQLPKSIQMHELQQVIQDKRAVFDKLKTQFITAANDTDTELASYASYRAGQLFLNFGCEVLEVELESEIKSEELKQVFRDAMRDQATQIIEHAQTAMLNASKHNITPWSTLAQEVLATTSDSSNPSEALLTACPQLTSHWKASLL